ncbi:putative ras-related protein Rab-5B [Tritrichomonas foetus]|uniref:Ras-related protein Rab-5B n=1 Tax=Tritrichomonas foetus TaxID=1144522 RepID=A0A1J4KEE5_9EUKA|nr:putative ras-related protein Rab-5B [Tritrichomonas foetus]|eukprot:OHT09807.1 putative ras-related protein Rab-5B [Tritrichomonas foetus]
MPTLKAILIGDTSVGKTCIAQRIVHGEFKETFATIGAANSSVKIESKKYQRPIIFNIWDTAGQERYRSLAPMYFNGAGIAFLVFDITKKSSFEALDVFIQLLKTKAPEDIKCVLVGNKVDLEENREVSSDDAKAFCENAGIIFYMETSAKSGVNIKDLFSQAADIDGLHFEPEVTDFTVDVDVSNNQQQQQNEKSCC